MSKDRRLTRVAKFPPAGFSETILAEAKAEAERDRAAAAHFEILMSLDLITALEVCSQLQLALRHPLNTGHPTETAKNFIAQITRAYEDAGFPATRQTRATWRQSGV